MSGAAQRSGTRPQIRIVHLGLGAFHRAHQAWYTVQAGDGWGIAAFTGRSATAAQTLNAQDGLYTLVTRGPEGDRFETIESIATAYAASDLDALRDLLSRGTTAIVTLTITEAGYKVITAQGQPVLDAQDPDVRHDQEALARMLDGGEAVGELRTAPARILLGLAARKAAGAGALAIVSCDNLPGNGAVTRAAVLGFAAGINAELAKWITANVSFVDTSIDRITPRTTEEDRATVAAETGFQDASPVVTEPFTSWVLQGDFPAGRPAWEKAGALFVDDLEPFERRKLWLLNGAHTLMAYAGQLRGHETVAQALADPQVNQWVQEFWDAAAAHLSEPGLDIPGYRQALAERFANPRIAHYLAQIGIDGSLKLAARAIPVYRAELAAGRDGRAALRPIAAWCDQLTAQRAAGAEVADAQAPTLEAALADSSGSREQTIAFLTVLDAQLAAEGPAVDGVHQLRKGFTS
ncbi:mannitol dehydrogenase family protein [Glutamicibacter sp. AOP38-B1-38]|uniref:mannitol dehydrogenase family protein n=1 Tax=Glutamicibacter sp. AOP38-B1-38 TaxID=3457680 RepID=UPI004034A335